MISEKLVESGVTVKSENGIAKVALIQTDSCEECSAKIFCNSTTDDKKLLEVIDPFNVNSGDRVQIIVEGKSILEAAILLYLIPLVLFVIGIIYGTYLFDGSRYNELYSFLTGLLLMGVHFLIVYFYSSKMNIRSKMPRITKIL